MEHLPNYDAWKTTPDNEPELGDCQHCGDSVSADKPLIMDELLCDDCACEVEIAVLRRDVKADRIRRRHALLCMEERLKLWRKQIDAEDEMAKRVAALPKHGDACTCPFCRDARKGTR